MIPHSGHDVRILHHEHPFNEQRPGMGVPHPGRMLLDAIQQYSKIMEDLQQRLVIRILQDVVEDTRRLGLGRIRSISPGQPLRLTGNGQGVLETLIAQPAAYNLNELLIPVYGCLPPRAV